jgi:Uma2 family endonuclease
MSAANKFIPRYTADDYNQWEGDWELWDGIPVAMSPSPFGRHQALATKLARILGNEIDHRHCHATVINEIDWIVSDNTIVRPDVVVLRGDAPERHLETTPALVVEVLSPSTAERDRTFKRDLYDRQGVRVYVLVDPEALTLETYQRDGAGQWQHQQIDEAIELRLCDDCTIDLSRASLFTS